MLEAGFYATETFQRIIDNLLALSELAACTVNKVGNKKDNSIPVIH